MGEGADARHQFDEHAPGGGRQLQPGDPAPTQRQQRAQGGEQDEGQVQQHTASAARRKSMTQLDRPSGRDCRYSSVGWSTTNTMPSAPQEVVRPSTEVYEAMPREW